MNRKELQRNRVAKADADADTAADEPLREETKPERPNQQFSL
jgi:hypothetical protein